MKMMTIGNYVAMLSKQNMTDCVCVSFDPQTAVQITCFLRKLERQLLELEVFFCVCHIKEFQPFYLNLPPIST